MPSGSAVAKSKQEKELDKDAGTFQETMDQGEVTDSEQGGEDGEVKDYFCEEGPWEEIEMVEMNDDAQCNWSYWCCGYKANVPKPFAFNYSFQLYAFM